MISAIACVGFGLPGRATEARGAQTAPACIIAGEGVSAPASTRCLIALRDRTTALLDPGAAVRILPDGSIALTGGEATFRAAHDADRASALVVTTPSAGRIALWEGELHVALRGDGAAFALIEGTARASSRTEALVTGTAVVIGSVHGATRVPESPRWSPYFAQDDRGAVAWAPVDGAASYRVEIARDAAMTDLVSREDVAGAAHSALLPRLSRGAYVVRVQAIAAGGVVGPASLAKMVNVP